MKVLHLISSGGMYGAEAVILNLSRELNSRRHASIVGSFANLSNPNLQLHEAATREGILSHLVPCTGQIDRKMPETIRDLVLEQKIDLVHAHGYKADIYTYFALRGSRVPFVSTCHSWYDNDLVVKLYGVADRFFLRSFDSVIAVSEEVKQRLLQAGVRSNKVNIIRNGIDLRPFENITPSLRDATTSFTIGLVGRLAPEKGIDVFLHAAKRVLDQDPTVRFVVIGDGPDREKLQNLIQDLGVSSNASLLGRRDDMPSVYASLDIMVSASRQEGLPMALLEGMASRLPIVATSVGEIPSLIQDQMTGILAPPNDPVALSEGILQLLRDRSKRELLSYRARRHVEANFTASHMAIDYLNIYKSVIRKSRHFEAETLDSTIQTQESVNK